MARSARGTVLGSLPASGLLPSLALAAGALPWLAYDVWLVTTQPDFAAWQAQNQTPSPPVWSYLVGFGWLLGWGIYGWYRKRGRSSPSLRLLIAWVVIGALMLYVPFGLQRRFSLGLFLPLAALAGLGLAERLGLHSRRAWAQYGLVLLISVPSNALVVTAGLSQVAAGNPLMVATLGETRAFAWLETHAPRGAVVLAAQTTGERLPAVAPVRVVVGHPFETPDFDQRLGQVVELFRDRSLGPSGAQARLRAWDVSYVFYGPAEAELGPKPTWLGDLPRVFSADDVDIYQVGYP